MAAKCALKTKGDANFKRDKWTDNGKSRLVGCGLVKTFLTSTYTDWIFTLYVHRMYIVVTHTLHEYLLHEVQCASVLAIRQQ